MKGAFQNFAQGATLSLSIAFGGNADAQEFVLPDYAIGAFNYTIDGDTFVMDIDRDASRFRAESLVRGDGGVHMRLWALDTPEKGQPGYAFAGYELSAFLEEIQGDPIYCDRRSDASRGRAVVQCFVEIRGAFVDVARHMIGLGYDEACEFSQDYYGTCTVELAPR